MGCSIAKDIVHNPASLHTGNDMFDEDTDTGDHRVLGFVFGAEFLPSWFFLRLIGQDLVRFKALKAGIFKEHTARRKRIALLITNAFIMDASSKGLAEIAHQTLFKINNEVIFYGMRFFLPLYFSCCSVVSCGRWMRRSVPSIMQSTDRHKASVCSRFFGSLTGNAWASPSAMCKTILSV